MYTHIHELVHPIITHQSNPTQIANQLIQQLGHNQSDQHTSVINIDSSPTEITSEQLQQQDGHSDHQQQGTGRDYSLIKSQFQDVLIDVIWQLGEEIDSGLIQQTTQDATTTTATTTTRAVNEANQAPVLNGDGNQSQHINPDGQDQAQLTKSSEQLEQERKAAQQALSERQAAQRAKDKRSALERLAEFVKLLVVSLGSHEMALCKSFGIPFADAGYHSDPLLA